MLLLTLLLTQIAYSQIVDDIPDWAVTIEGYGPCVRDRLVVRLLADALPMTLMSDRAQLQDLPSLHTFAQSRNLKESRPFIQHQLDEVARASGFDRIIIVDLNPGGDLLEERGLWLAQPEVERATFDGLVVGVSPPSDTYFEDQWSLHNTGYGDSLEAAVDINFLAAWEAYRDFDLEPVVIAILDTGVAGGHPDLENQLVGWHDAVGVEETYEDGNGHGTSVASIAAASTNNNEGIAGTAWNADIYAIRVLDCECQGSAVGLANGLDVARQQDVNVISMSLIGYTNTDELQSAVQNAYNANIPLISAAGNRLHVDQSSAVQYPGRYDQTLAVGALTPHNVRKELDDAWDETSHANWGSCYGSQLDIMAPGYQIIAASNNYNYNHEFWGTSAATPLVAGVAALLKGVNPDLTPQQIYNIITESATPLGGDESAWHNETGWGRLDAYAALNAANTVCFTEQVPPTITHSSYCPMNYDGDYEVIATITDECELYSVVLQWQNESDNMWSECEMCPIDTDTYHASIPPQVAGSIVWYRIIASDEAHNQTIRAYEFENVLTDEIVEVQNEDEFRYFAESAGNLTLSIQNDFILSNPVEFLAAASVDIRGPATITFEPEARLLAPSSAQVRLHDLNLVGTSEGTALVGAITEVDNCTFSGFFLVHDMSAAHGVTYKNNSSISNSSYIFHTMSCPLVVNQCQIELKESLLLQGSCIGQIHLLGSEFTYTPDTCDPTTAAYGFEFLLENAVVDIHACTFYNGGKWRVNHPFGVSSLGASFTITDSYFLNPTGNSACALEFDYQNHPSGDELDVLFGNVVMEDLAHLDLNECRAGSVTILNSIFRGRSNLSSFLMPGVTTETQQRCSWSIENSVFSDFHFDFGNYLLFEPELSVRNSTFTSRYPSQLLTLGSQAGVHFVETILDMPIERNCVDVSYENCATRDATEVQIYNDLLLVLDPKFVDADADDYRLRWDSPCLDGGPEDELEFDMTPRDLGWQPLLARVILGSDTPRDVLDVAEYDVVGNTEIRADLILAGTKIRVNPGVSLNLISEGGLVIGDSDGPRTTITGGIMTEIGWRPCDGILFKSASSHPSVILFGGTHFNRPANNPNSGKPWLVFKNVDLALDFSDAPNCAGNTFAGYGNTEFILDGCEGVLGGINFGNGDYPDYLAVSNSSTRIVNCVISSTEEVRTHQVRVNGVAKDGQDLEFIDCEFNCDNSHIDHFLSLNNTSVRMRDVSFNDYHGLALQQIHSSLYMSHNASCKFEANSQTTAPLIYMQGGLLDLFCGYNHFLHGNLEHHDFISYENGLDSYPAVYDWRKNLWSDACPGTPYTDEDEIQNYIEVPWAQVVQPLSTCSPNPATCEDWTNDPRNLLEAGKEAESESYLAVARAYFRDVCLLFPRAPEVSEASNRLKAIGQQGDFGADQFELICQDLFAAALISDAELVHPQAILQECNAWLVKGYHGERALVQSRLEDMIKSERDPRCLKTINTALLELRTYPPLGAMSSQHPSERIEQAIVQAKNMRDFLFSSGDSTAPTEEVLSGLPSDFEITSAYPNPFNPVSTIHLNVPISDHVKVGVFNLLGQEITILLEAELEAGAHKMQFDGNSFGSGLYIIRAESSFGFHSTQKVMLLK
jgi:hypothetical protein